MVICFETRTSSVPKAGLSHTASPAAHHVTYFQEVNI